MTIEVTPASLAMEVILRTKETTFLRLPRELQREIPCGCDCSHCTKDPALAKWDTLAIATKTPKGNDFSWTVHMPDASVADTREYFRKKEQEKP
jgi:hypothetical protein